jgi:hypothetical protein
MDKGTMRGRPPLRMTHRRRQVLAEIAELIAKGERVTLSRLARRCGLYDYRDARRIMSDLRKMQRI